MTYDIHRKARQDRSAYIGQLIGEAIASAIQFVSKAWRSSSSRGTNSSALS
jgi:hypothetical protein